MTGTYSVNSSRQRTNRVGYDDAVAETDRLTEARPELDEQEQRAINERLAYIVDHIHEQPEVRVKYFVPDEHKSGGAIVEAFDYFRL